MYVALLDATGTFSVAASRTLCAYHVQFCPPHHCTKCAPTRFTDVNVRGDLSPEQNRVVRHVLYLFDSPASCPPVLEPLRCLAHRRVTVPPASVVCVFLYASDRRYHLVIVSKQHDATALLHDTDPMVLFGSRTSRILQPRFSTIRTGLSLSNPSSGCQQVLCRPCGLVGCALKTPVFPDSTEKRESRSVARTGTPASASWCGGTSGSVCGPSFPRIRTGSWCAT
jgi:hypothetical protein